MDKAVEEFGRKSKHIEEERFECSLKYKCTVKAAFKKYEPRHRAIIHEFLISDEFEEGNE